MGCAASADAAPARRTPAHYKLIVLDFEGSLDETGQVHGEEGPLETRMDVYSLKRFKHLNSIHVQNDRSDRAMYLCGDFSVACHREKPYMIITGGTWTDEEGKTKLSDCVWKVDIENDVYEINKLCDLPYACQGHLSGICCHGDNSYLYVFTSENATWCLNLETNNWEALQNLPFVVDDVRQIVCYKDIIGFISNKFDLHSFRSPRDSSSDWVELFCKPLPVGLSCEAEGYLYSLSGDDNALFTTNLTTAEFSRVTDIDDLDIATLQKSTSLAGCADHLYFSGHHYSADTKSLIEVDLTKKRTLVAGYLHDNSDRHQMMACQC